MTDERLEELWRQADSRWERHRRVLEARPETDLHGSGSGWRARDEYAHLGRRFQHALPRLQAAAEGVRPPIDDLDAETLNARWQDEDRALDLAEARRRCEEARQALLDGSAAIAPRAPAEREIEILTGALVGHLDEHFGYVVQGLLHDEERQWRELSTALDDRPAELVHGEPDPWESREVYMHLARWFERAVRLVEGHLAGAALPAIANPDEVNAAWRTDDRDVSFADARARAFAERERVLALIRSIPQELWDAEMVDVFEVNTAAHYRDHIGWLTPTS